MIAFHQLRKGNAMSTNDSNNPSAVVEPDGNELATLAATDLRGVTGGTLWSDTQAKIGTLWSGTRAKLGSLIDSAVKNHQAKVEAQRRWDDSHPGEVVESLSPM